MKNTMTTQDYSKQPVFESVTERTLCFLLDNHRVLLGFKKKGQGASNYNGFGGKKENGESIRGTAIREIYEESGLRVQKGDLAKMAILDFYFPNKREWDQTVHVYFARRWEGEPVETDEMRPEWFSIKNIPYDNMWDSDRRWLPLLLSGKRITGIFTWADDNKTVKDYITHEVSETFLNNTDTIGYRHG